jgi:hypothetical protein
MTDFRALCAELVDELEDWIAYGDEADCADAHAFVDRARAALAQPEPQGPTGCPAIEPVPVAERLPGPEDCDAEGRCWWFSPLLGGWKLCDARGMTAFPFWLPHHALPVPQP